MAAAELDAVDGGIRTFGRGRQRVGDGRHREHATPGGYDLAVGAARSACVEHGGPGELG
jgi:hypothetical protein